MDMVVKERKNKNYYTENAHRGSEKNDGKDTTKE